MERFGLAVLALLTVGCAHLSTRPQPSLRRSLGVAPAALAGTSADQPAQGYCATSWRISVEALEIYSLAPATGDVESLACAGKPVFLIRPVCMLTAREAILYPRSTPAVGIKCPYGAAVWITGYPEKR